MSIKNLVLISVFASAAVVSGCKTGLLGGTETPPVNQPTAAPAAPLVVDGNRTSYADVVERTSPAVVRIEAEHKATKASVQPGPTDDFFKQFQLPQQNRRPQVERGVGSGVLVSADGSILTNHHVVDGADKITVLMSDNKSYEAKVVGTDQPSDLAVLKIEGQGLPFLNLGNSDSVRVGDIVLAIGNPLGIGQTVTAGIISAKGRRTGLSDGNSFEDFLQTDAPINRGNSGGALVNLAGELIGINSQILSGGAGGGNIGIAFSIPSNMAKSVMEQLIKDGRVRRGQLGINIQNVTDELAKSLDLEARSGVIVSNVRTGSAAEKAGIKRNDLIIAINGEKIEDSNVLRNKVASSPPGSDIKITVQRDGKQVDLTATLDEAKLDGEKLPGPGGNEDGPGPQNQGGKLGLSLEPVSPTVAKQLGLDGTEGVVVTDVDQDGPAAESGIARGDVILEINRKPVSSVADVRAALDGAGNRSVVLLVNRRGQTSYLTVQPE